MAFTIELMRNESEKRQVTKQLTTITSMSGTLRTETSIINPVILVQAELDELTGCNYMHVPAWGRYYFVNDIRSVREGLVSLSCHVDVLTSFAAEIKENSGIVRRAESSEAYNLYLNDGSLVAYQDPYILTEPFPGGFTRLGFILAVAGA